MTRTLVVPMLVDGIALSEGRTVVGPPDYRRLPYTAKEDGGQRDVNVGNPFLAESTHNEVFSDDSLQLGAGVHLHWTMPRPLRTAVHPVDAKTGAVDQSKAVFRKAPDRWLVCRWAGSELQKCWLIEGDFVWSWDDPAASTLGDALSVWPWRMVRESNGSIRFDTTVGEPPWRYVGRSRKLGEAWPNQKPGTSLKSVGEPLTAEGYGDPTFAAYYPSCRSIFGHHDPVPSINDALSYEVFGWYSTAADDPVAELAGRFASDAAKFRHRLKRDFEWSWDQGESPPERMLCYGRLHAKNFTGEARDAAELQLAIAGSGTEALAALLAHKMAARRYPNDPPRQLPEQQRLEQHLDALLMSSQLKGHQVDIGDQLAIARHQRSFQAVHGSVLHVLRPRGTEGKVDPGLVLPASLAADVDRLNAAQANFDSRQADVAALRRRVYSEWYRAVKATDPPLGTNRCWVLSERDPSAGHDADSIYALLWNRTLPALKRALAETADLAKALQMLRAKIDAAVKEHNAQPNAQTWSLDTIPGPRYFAPADPTVALLGPAIKASDRWSEDSLERDGDDCVQCKVQAGFLEVLSALGAPGGADTRLTDCLKAGPLRSALDVVLKTSLLDREPGHVHLFSMEWEVQYAPVLKSPQAADPFPTDFLQKNWKLGEFDHALEDHPELKFGDTEMIGGSSLLLQHASPVMKDALEGYILGRLSEPVVAVDDGTNQPLHPLTAAVKPPAKVSMKTWLEAYAAGAELTESLLAKRHADIHDWVETTFTARRTLQAAEALVRYQQVQRPEALKKSNRVYGLPDGGKVAEAICGVINGYHGDAGFFQNTLQLPRELADKLANLPTVESLQAVDAALGWGAVPFARLLQRAETESLFGIIGVEQAVRGHALVHGMPQGGGIAKVFCKLVNTLQDTELLDKVGLRPEVVESILEARVTPIISLARLASLPHVTPATFARLLVYAEQAGAFANLNEEAVIPEPGSWEDTNGQEVVDPLRTALEAWKALSEMPNVLTHTLGGFHDNLLQWENAPQLPVADPVGFSDYRQFAEELVRPAVGNAPRKAPLPNARFHPIRAGDMRLQRLRLIDTFGQKREVSIGNVRTTTEMTTRSGFHAALPPRISQPVRLDFRWQAADGHGQEWTPHPTTSPICGWLVADNADESLVFYHAGGRMLGSLDHRGRWRLAPSATAPVRPQDIENPNLRKLVVYLARKAAEDPNANPSFIARFVGLVDDALESIHPPQSPNEESLSLLMSRPVALVRTSIQVELRDPPATRQDLEALIAELQGRLPLTDRFEEVELPIRIGEHGRLNDGVVAWWMEDSLGSLEENARAPQQGTQQISLSPAQGTRTFSVLLDPHGSIHATCGVLPTRVLTLPTDVYAPALGRMELRMLAAPILTQRGQFQLPIPKEPGWTWSYLYRTDGGWGEIGAEPQIEKAVLEKCFPKQPDLWYRLVHCGALATQPDDPTRARVCFPAPPADPKAPPPQLEDTLKEFSDAIEIARVLKTQSHRLEVPIPGPAFQPLELREGWLRLRRSTP